MQEMFIISMKCKASIYTKISAIYYYKQQRIMGTCQPQHSRTNDKSNHPNETSPTADRKQSSNERMENGEERTITDVTTDPQNSNKLDSQHVQQSVKLEQRSVDGDGMQVLSPITLLIKRPSVHNEAAMEKWNQSTYSPRELFKNISYDSVFMTK